MLISKNLAFFKQVNLCIKMAVTPLFQSNYICQKHYPIKKIFERSLREKGRNAQVIFKNYKNHFANTAM